MPSESISIGNDLAMEKSIEAELNEKESKLLKKRKEKIEEDFDLYKLRENFYSTPIKKYLKYKKKRNEYRKLYHHSRFKYYTKIKLCLIGKMIRKQLFSKLLYSVAFSIGTFILLKNTRLGISIVDYFEKHFNKLVNYFKSLNK